ncbi:hypothetical protein F511_24946 [Dorcoceras hygrometricum]|uniref:LOW protein: ammonium transporter 1-like protein n=1 Tax=Dorcoceras hygrometricum TaxID=472368 RepID=A0A2Z7CIN0_9LAMI|nr:hypothetical protein F511_24946 [Dorcoceras hygrometricum]
MATATIPVLHLQPPSCKPSSTFVYSISRNPRHVPFFHQCKTFNFISQKKVPFAVTESSDSPEVAGLRPTNSPPGTCSMHQNIPFVLKDSFVLPSDYFSKLPRDLRLDLNDAAFDLSNGPVKDECGEDMGETLLDISRAWELAETSTSAKLVSKLPLLLGSISSFNKQGKSTLALGKRLVSAGRRFQSMGQYGQGELQKIAKVMINAGNLLSASPVPEVSNEEPKQESRMLKFGDLQVALTPDKAYIGAGIGLIFGILSWQLSQGIQSIPESSLEYANDNALLLAKSLRGALLAIFYSSAVLSAFATAGLILLGGRLNSKGK